MNVNRHLNVPLIGFEDVAQVMKPPRGQLFEFAMNPFNGNLIYSWQDSPESRFYTRMILAQLSKYPDCFDEQLVTAYHEGLLLPGCEDLPVFDFAEVM